MILIYFSLHVGGKNLSPTFVIIVLGEFLRLEAQTKVYNNNNDDEIRYLRT